MIILILENIRSTHNVGSIFRTADAAGVDHIYLIGITPSPIDRFGRKRTDITKASLGAENSVAWSYEKTTAPVLTKLKKNNFKIIALEQSPKAIDYRKFAAKSGDNLALVLGNEVTGVYKKTLAKVDTIIEIPMQGHLARNRKADERGKESLNVSVAAGIALFKLREN